MQSSEQWDGPVTAAGDPGRKITTTHEKKQANLILLSDSTNGKPVAVPNSDKSGGEESSQWTRESVRTWKAKNKFQFPELSASQQTFKDAGKTSASKFEYKLCLKSLHVIDIISM